MELEFTLEKADLLEYNAYATKARSGAMRSRLKSVLLTWTALCLLIVLSGIFLNRDNLIETTLVFLALLLSLLAYVKIYMKRFLNLFYSPEFFPDMFVPQKVVLDSNMFVNVRQNSRDEILWSGIKEIAHTQAHTFILLPNATGFIVPHRIFRNSTEIQGFKDQLEAFWNRGKTNGATLFSASAK